MKTSHKINISTLTISISMTLTEWQEELFYLRKKMPESKITKSVSDIVEACKELEKDTHG